MPQTPSPRTITLLKMLSSRLERLSADSLWARRASGVRRSLLKQIDTLEAGQPVPAQATDRLIEEALALLTHAAREIPEQSSAPSPPDSEDQAHRKP